MGLLTKTLAALCAILFVLSAIFALLAFNLEWYAFDAAVYKRAFERQNLYARTPDLVATALHGYLSANPNADPYLRELTIQDWTGTVASAVPPTELKILTDRTVDSVFDYLNYRSSAIVVSLLPLKGQLGGPAGLEIVQRILNAQPDCTLQQLLQVAQGFVAGDFTLCNPPPEMLGAVAPLIEAEVRTMVAAVPDQITLMTVAPGQPDPRARLQQARTVMAVTPVFPLLFLFGLTVFAVRSLRDWLQWWGYPFLLAGGVSLLIALLSASSLGRVLQSVLQHYSLGLLPPVLLSTFGETVSAVTGEILRPVFYEALALAVVGFLMVLTSLFLSYRVSRAI